MHENSYVNLLMTVIFISLIILFYYYNKYIYFFNFRKIL